MGKEFNSATSSVRNSAVDDAELLRAYCTSRSEEAFTELVRRHLNLVYSAALRRTGEAHGASDVSQIVFAKLARHAAALSKHPVLTGWLYKATRTTAIDYIRSEQNRRVREGKALLMNELTADSESAPDWDRLRPVLDGAMDQLADEDRVAILLRYFENRPFSEVGRALRLSEDSARKRVDRALRKLHRILVARGISSSSAALCLVLSSASVAAAPSGLAATVASSAITESIPSVPSANWKNISSRRISMAAVGAALLLVTGSIGYLNRNRFFVGSSISGSVEPSVNSKISSATPATVSTGEPKAQTNAVLVWQSTLRGFDASDYDRSVEAIISSYELETAHRLAPGSTRRVGLKIYTDSGPQLATPVSLVNAVVSALERRDFEGKNIFIVGLTHEGLRQAGFLPQQDSDIPLFEGHPVYVLESGNYYRKGWYYDHPLPTAFNSSSPTKQTGQGVDPSTDTMLGTSYLDVPLASQTDFWINLPVYTNDSVLGVNGALLNATLWNASNTARFLNSPAFGPAAVAEMSAIPELKETCVFTLTSLQTYQFFGGPPFDSRYTASEPLLLLSANPVMLDALMRDRINGIRRQNGLPAISDKIRTLEDAEAIGSGSAQTKNARIIAVGD